MFQMGFVLFMFATAKGLVLRQDLIESSNVLRRFANSHLTEDHQETSGYISEMGAESGISGYGGTVIEDTNADDPSTSSIALLRIITLTTLRGFIVYNNESLGCNHDCLINRSALKLSDMPHCDILRWTCSKEALLGNLKNDIDNLNIYEYYLNHYRTNVPQQTYNDLKAVAELIPQFEVLFEIDVYQRSCELIEAEEVQLNPVIPMYSDILEASRTYLFLEQFTDFLTCFLFTYEQFLHRFALKTCDSTTAFKI